jgi:4-hydroxybenzoyl-CoA reductase subunit alpha
VPKVWISHDIGRALNPTLARGQLVGGVYMAVGEALMESQIARDGRPRGEGRYLLRNPSMLDYKSLTHLDMPEVVTDLVEEPCPEGPYGAKEIGQGPLTPVIPAIANAIYQAVGVRMREVPIAPDKLLAAIEARQAGGDGIVGPGPFPTGVPYPPPLSVPPPWEGGDGRASGEGDYVPGAGSKARAAAASEGGTPR